MRGFKVEGAEERAAAELRQLKQQFDSGAITSDVYEARRKPLLAIMIAGQESEPVKMRDEPAAAGGSGPAGGRRAPLPRVHAMHAIHATPAGVPAVSPAASPPLRVAGGAADAAKHRQGASGQEAPRDLTHEYGDGFDLSTAEKAVRHEFDPGERKWSRTAFLCRVEANPFAEGAMRTAHRLFDLAASGPDGLFVVKFSKDPKESPQRFFDDVEMQMEARMWAQKFNESGPPKAVDFIAAYVLELVDRPGKPLCAVEKFIPGNYVKWNNNWDWSDELRNTPQAFSHFTWQASGHRLLVCDLQGVGDLWTDPQIHTADKKRYGKGNLGMEGINKFLAAHRCNSICDFYGLSPTPSSNPRRNFKSRGAHVSSGPQRTMVAPAASQRAAASRGLNAKGLVGVGLALASRPPDGLVVTQVLPHGPAFKDGRVMAGDLLQSVGGRKAGRVVEDVKGLILGPPGTTVVLGLKRGSSSFEVTLVRMLSDLPQGQRLVDSQKQRSIVSNSQRSSGNPRKSLMQRVVTTVFGTKSRKSAGGPSGPTAKDKRATPDKESGYDDPDVFSPAAAGTKIDEAEGLKPAGWDDPDIMIGSTPSRRYGATSGNLAVLKEQPLQEWLMVEDGGVVGGVVGAGGWRALELDEDVDEKALRALLMCLFRHVQREDGSAGMFRLSSVCRIWRAVSLDTSLWKTVRCGDDCYLDDESLASICNRARGDLDVLDVATSPQDAKELRGELSLSTIIRAVQFNPSIQELHVSGCSKHTEYDLAEFGLVLQDLSRLQALSMEACELTSRSVQKMLSLFVCSTSLESLSLAHNKGLGSDGVSALCAALRVNRALTSLDLRGCHVDRSASENLAQVLLSSPSLTDLQIDEAEECSVAMQHEVQRHSMNIQAMQKQLIEGAIRDEPEETGREAMYREKKVEDTSETRQKRGVCDGGFVGGLAGLYGGSVRTGAEAGPSVGGQSIKGDASGRVCPDAAAHKGDELKEIAPAIPLAVAPKFSRTVGCQSKMSWKEFEAEREKEKEAQRRAAAEARDMLGEAQKALRAMVAERARLIKENQRLTGKLAEVESDQEELEAASTALLEQERAKMMRAGKEAEVRLQGANAELERAVGSLTEAKQEAEARLQKVEKAVQELEQLVATANASEAKAHLALEGAQQRLASAEQETVRRIASAKEAEAKANEVLLQNLEARVAASADAEAQALMHKDALSATVDLLKQKLATQELEHKEEERRWREELETAARLGERRCKASSDEAVKPAQGGGNAKDVAESKRVMPEEEEGEALEVGPSQRDTLDPVSAAPLTAHATATQSSASSHTQHGSLDTTMPSSVLWKGEGEGKGTPPVEGRPPAAVPSGGDEPSRPVRQGKISREDKLGGLGEAVEGLGRASSELLGGVWGGLGGLVGIGSGAEEKQQLSAVRSRVATIEEVESSLDPRTREAVRVLILKGRTDKQVAKHYTLTDRGVSEEQVQAVRAALALAHEHTAQQDASESGRRAAGPGLQLTSERPYSVVAIISGSPADLCGQIRIGDVLVGVQGQDLDYKTADEVRALMQGPAGSVVGLRFSRFVAPAHGDVYASRSSSECFDVMLERAPAACAASVTAASAAASVDDTFEPTSAPAESQSCEACAETAEPAPKSNAPAGLGFTFQRDASARYWVVRRLKDGGFAQTSGLISPGDILLKVDGKSVSGIENPEEVALLIAGQERTTCLLELKGARSSQIREVEGIRGRSSSNNLQHASARVYA